MERQPRRRRRPALSCLGCRRRKIKCDRKEPCSHCVSAKISCTYKVYSDELVIEQRSQQDGGLSHSTSSPSAHSTSPLSQVQQTSANRPTVESSNHLSRPQGSLALTVPTSENEVPNNSGWNNTQSSANTQNLQPDFENLLRRLQKLEETSAPNPIHGLFETGRDILVRQSGLQNSQIILNKTRILRWSHWMGMTKEFATVSACYTEASENLEEGSSQGVETKALLEQINSLLHKCKSIARNVKVGRPSRFISSPGSNLTIPSREMADKMVTLYFQSFESTHRILHEPSFWIEYQKYWNHPENVKTNLRLKILLVIGIGSSLYEHEDIDAVFQNNVHQWVYAAQNWLSGPLEKDRLDITGLQIHCLTLLAREIFSIGGDLVWISVGSLIHQAMQIGLHRDPKHLPEMSILEAEIRRRLWATVLEMIVQSSLDSAMPTRISFDDFDTEAPSNNNDDEIGEFTSVLQPQPKDRYTSMSMQLILLDSLPIRLKILQLLNGLHSDISYLNVLALSSEITDSCRAYNRFMKDNEQSSMTPFRRNLLDYLVRRFMIPLHCPFASQARTNPLFYYSLKASIDAALAIISPEPDKNFYRLMAISGGLFKEGFRCAMTAISLELIAQVETQRLDGTLHRNSQYVELLKKAMREMIQLSTERIRLGETNVKSHMFLSMIMAHVEAIETGTSRKLKVIQSARDSLEFCYELLQAKIDITPISYLNNTGVTSATIDSGQESYGFDSDLEFFFPDIDLMS